MITSKNSKMKKGFKTLLIIFSVLLVLLGVGVLLLKNYYDKTISTPVSVSEDVVRFEIKLGQDINTTARELKNEGLISSADVFYWYLRINNLIPEIKAGTFILRKNMTMVEIAKALQDATADDTSWVTIPEGLRMDEIGDVLEEELATSSSKFKREEFDDIVENPDNYTFSSSVQDFLDTYKPEDKPLEGFLYPDTYNFTKEVTAQQVVEKLVTTLKTKVADIDIDTKARADMDFYGVLTLASMIERETFTKAEKPMVADVLIKRLEGKLQGVKLLQVDATLLYEKKDWKANAFLLKDKVSPYNTYKVTGLTPTPIANPGIDAIKAVYDPEPNDYFYYLHDDQGVVHYAKTLAEHNDNKVKYIDN